MSEVIDPPEYYFSGINFNPAFYANEAAGFTEAQANALYLRKTVPDTATAVETFNAGINVNGVSAFSNSVSVTGATSDLLVANSTVPTKYITLSTSGVAPTITLTDTTNSLELSPAGIEPVTGAPPTLNIATTSNVDLNVGTGTRNGTGTFVDPYIIHNYSDGNNCTAGNGVHLNNGTNNNSNTNIHNGQTSGGNVNIMTGTSSTGSVNILSGTSASGNVNIHNGTSSSGDINIGIAGVTTKITGDTNINGTINLNGAGSTSNNVITIGNSTLAGTTYLSSPNTYITKTVTNTIDTQANNNAITIGGNQTATGGDINLGSTSVARSGSVNIMTAVGSGGNVNIMTGLTSTGSVTIGNVNGFVKLTGPTTVSVTPADTSSDLNVPNTSWVLSRPKTFSASQSFTAQASFSGTIFGILCSRIGGLIGQTTQSLFDNTSGSTVDIGLNSTVTVSDTLKCDTYNATTPTLGTMTIGNNATSTRINIGSGQTTGRLDIGANGTRTGDIYIGGASSTTYAGGTVNIGETTTTQTIKGSIVNIGSSGSTTNIKGGLTLDAPITPNYSYPVASGKIGYSSPVTYVSPPTLVAGAPKTIASVSIPAGVWYLMGHMGFPSSAVSSYAALSISTVTNILQASPAMINTQTSPTFTLDNVTSTIVTVSTTTTYYLTAQMAIAVTLTDVYFQAVRIA